MGGLLDKPVTEKRTAAGESDRMAWSATDMQGWRRDMEDEHIAHADLGDEFANVGLFCVFDGHGGKAVSRFCEREFVSELRLNTVEVGRKAFGKNKNKKRHCGSHLEAKEFEKILTDTFHGMDVKLKDPANAKTLARFVGKVPGGAIQDLKKKLQVAQQAHQAGKLSPPEIEEMKESYVRLQKFEQAEKGEEFTADNVGCTAVCVLVRKEEVITANAGDSRAIMCRAGKAVELSFDHKPASDIEKTRIEKAGGFLEDTPGGHRVNGNLNLSRAIGDLEYKKRDDLTPEEQIICSTPDVTFNDLTPEDEFVVLACDGVWDVMSNQDVCDFVRPRLLEKKSVTEIGVELLDHCITEDPAKTQGLGTDNMTAVVVKLKDATSWQ
eukprot:TRINITY_DN25431_c0_g1_i1.p1 TRINITY_DN25431_c0_g1~~TRINITY_DN25431_c0_g1_i1.p1  ORF type:complete len:381 (+),score=108.72 TRINITY_DN25431_c0_g1_i1:70-1212(+)